jgi:hypothetical protein
LEFFRHMDCAKVMVVNCPSAKPLPIRRDWFPGATWVDRFPNADDFRAWLPGLDVVYTAETGYGRALWPEARRAGVKTVLHANYEFLDRDDHPTLWAAPSKWHFNELPRPRVLLPVPIASDRFAVRADFPAARPAARFLHIVGRPAIHDRNGTADLLQALKYVRSDATVTIRCQEPGYVEKVIDQVASLGNATVQVETGDTVNYWDNYDGQDVLVLPRRFGGLCLPAQEAIGAGLPVIMPDICPNNAWLPHEWLVPAGWCRDFHAKQRVDVYSANHRALAAKIDEFATTPATGISVYAKAARTARDLATSMSWQTLKPEYEKVLAEL